MPIQSANTYQKAIDLISSHPNAVFEVTKDGSIREQTGFEKFKLFASKLVRSYDVKKNSKDAAVAKALSQLHSKDKIASQGPILSTGVTKRFFDAQRHIDQRTAKKTEQLRVDNSSIDRLKTQSAKKATSQSTTSVHEATTPSTQKKIG